MMKKFIINPDGRVSEAKSQEIKAGGSSDYQKIAAKLGFKWESASSIGFLSYDYKADLIMRIVKEYSRNLVHSIGFPIYEMKGSNAFDMRYPVVQAYAKLYGDRLLKMDSKGKQLLMSYDCSYPQFNLASEMRLSEKMLPFGHYSISDCYRNEQRGECMILYRNRRFFMPDLHPYFLNAKHAFKWFSKLEEKIVSAAKQCNIEYIVSCEVASPEVWKEYRSEIIRIAKDSGRQLHVEILDDKKPRYWIINVDYNIVDKLGQMREIGCIQIDVGNAERLGIKFMDSNGNEKHPVIVHSAIPGGIERFIYMAIDNFPDSFPLWMHPIQVRLIPVSDRYNNLALQIIEKYKASIRIDLDDQSEPVGKKVKRAREELIPNIIVVGEEELNGGGNIDMLNEIHEKLSKLPAEIPFIKFGWPAQLSKRI